MDDIAQFWMVLGENSEQTRFRHDKREKAVAEARRLASLNKGVKFFVLECIGAAVTDDPVKWLQVGDELPF